MSRYIRPLKTDFNQATKNFLHIIIQQSYKDNPKDFIRTDDYEAELLLNTPTIKIYFSPASIQGAGILDFFGFRKTRKTIQRDGTYIVAVRGTKPTDFGDLEADASIPLNDLIGTDRFQADLRIINDFRKFNTGGIWIGVGHSLGGAIIDQLLKLRIIRWGYSYNPAIQPEDSGANLNHYRIYAKGDLLYQNLAGSEDAKEVRDIDNGALGSHKLDVFVVVSNNL
jgi:hypothetical protein